MREVRVRVPECHGPANTAAQRHQPCAAGPAQHCNAAARAGASHTSGPSTGHPAAAAAVWQAQTAMECSPRARHVCRGAACGSTPAAAQPTRPMPQNGRTCATAAWSRSRSSCLSSTTKVFCMGACGCRQRVGAGGQGSRHAGPERSWPWSPMGGCRCLASAAAARQPSVRPCGLCPIPTHLGTLGHRRGRASAVIVAVGEAPVALVAPVAPVAAVVAHRLILIVAVAIVLAGHAGRAPSRRASAERRRDGAWQLAGVRYRFGSPARCVWQRRGRARELRAHARVRAGSGCLNCAGRASIGQSISAPYSSSNGAGYRAPASTRPAAAAAPPLLCA